MWFEDMPTRHMGSVGEAGFLSFCNILGRYRPDAAWDTKDFGRANDAVRRMSGRWGSALANPNAAVVGDLWIKS